MIDTTGLFEGRTGLAAPLAVILCFLCAGGVGPLVAADTQRLTFGSPDEAVTVFIDALRADDKGKLLSVLGPDAADVIASGDDVADRKTRADFLRAFDTVHRIERVGLERAELAIGRHDWPFPIPMVRDGQRWYFDTRSGKDEILNRRIGRNELNTMEALRIFVRAQREYHAKNPTGDGVPQYAQRFLSTAGQRDGLYWPTGQGEDQSPLGPLATEAVAEGYVASPPGAKPRAFHGYVFRVLKGQGPNAEGGARSYMENGKMTQGFAAVAYPAQRGVTGVMTFLVSMDGVVYEKDLRDETQKVASSMELFDPDESWNEVR